MQGSQKYSKSEILLHTTKTDCWLVLHGKVYDVTTFLEDHPGGDEVLLHASAAGDATQSFEEVGHSSTATSMMHAYFIGSVQGHMDSTDPSALKGAPPAPTGSGSPGNKSVLLEKKLPPSSNFLLELILPLLVLALAFGAWYYLTYINVKAY